MIIHHGPFIQRGRGLGSLLGSLFKAVIPVASRVGRSIIRSPITKSVLRTAKDAAIEGGLSLAVDALRGNKVAESAQQNVEQAKNKIADAIEKGTINRKRKSKVTRKPVKKKVYVRKPGGKRQKRDIFSNE
jgi:hypothetical protein